MAITAGDEIKASEINAGLNAKVNNTGNETVAGIKTFSSIPILPASDPTTDNQAVRKLYADGKNIVFKNGIITRALNGGDGAVNTAHGLGKTPTKVKMTAFAVSTFNSTPQSIGTWTSSGTQTIKLTNEHSTVGLLTNKDTTYMVVVLYDGYGQKGVLTVDATNLTLTWTKEGSPGAMDIYILWEAEAQ